MGITTITQLPSDGVITGSEEIPIWDALGKTKKITINQLENFIVISSPVSGAESINGGIFITDIVPTGVGNVGQKVRSSGNIVLDTCISDTNLVTVSIIAITGHTNFIPNATVNERSVVLVASPDRPMFTGSVDIDLQGNQIVTAVHEDGAFHQVEVMPDEVPIILSAYFANGYPGSQTELKFGDNFDISLLVHLPIIAIEIQDFGACSYNNISVASNTQHVVSATIANRGASLQALSARIRVQKATGTWSQWYDTSNTVNLNNLYPSVSINSISYPPGQGAIKNSETALVLNSCSNFNTILYSSQTSELSFNNNSTYEPTKAATRIAGNYNATSQNVLITATRLANNATSTANSIVKISNISPTISISTPYQRLRSGGTNGAAVQNYTITLSSSQQLSSAPSLNAPTGTWITNFTGGPTNYNRTLQIHDNDSKGIFSFNSLFAISLSGLQATVISSGQDYTIGGFVFRTLIVPAYPIREVNIGTEVINTAKLRCTNLSKGTTGSLNFTYQATTTEAINKFTVVNGNTWYNCDGANASSNTTGTMQIEIEEVV
jgi:hypothetical protein